ncbi:hypothetical protein [Methylobacterium brachythecii]|uniref:Uncharacterized protein n=1 Tax=Methylobacterium brachythecii TaxID=1176177 RepID=A0A7W6AIZ3_9HYPH|nr:hypothetical protein [Methylobacterium brachythecii]MBB3904227.1 hypothetical protein [Methylobacterium brachythecii]GLS45111.1 hypothetical protein GCM10007884_31000 [Methylobacterium brachythecii]
MKLAPLKLNQPAPAAGNDDHMSNADLAHILLFLVMLAAVPAFAFVLAGGLFR